MNESAPSDFSAESDLTELTADIVSAYVAHNPISSADLPRMIGEIYAALKNIQAGKVEEAATELSPAVSVRKSITPDYLVCLDDGKKFKSLKRHLNTLGMTPEQYREKWKLPTDYPMVAPNYSVKRSKLALSNGLGRKTNEPGS